MLRRQIRCKLERQGGYLGFRVHEYRKTLWYGYLRGSGMHKEKSLESSLNEKWTLDGSTKAAGYWAIKSAGGVSIVLMIALCWIVKGVKGNTRKVQLEVRFVEIRCIRSDLEVVKLSNILFKNFLG
jgi:hypothetical protein